MTRASFRAGMTMETRGCSFGARSLFSRGTARRFAMVWMKARVQKMRAKAARKCDNALRYAGPMRRCASRAYGESGNSVAIRR